MRRVMAIVGFFVAGCLLLMLTHVDAQQSFLLVTCVALQAWAGGYLWRVVMPRAISILEVLGAGLAVGSAGAALSAAVASLLPLSPATRPWAWCVIPGLAIVLWLTRRSAKQTLPDIKPTSAGVRIAMLIGLLLGLVTWLVNVRNYPVNWSGELTTYHPDMLFFQAVSTSTASLGVNDSILMTGADLRYHWFAYGWAGQLSETTDALPFVVLTRLLPLVAIASLVLLSATWAARMSRVRWVPALAVVLVVAGGYVGASYGTILNADSPSQALSMTWLVALSMSFLAYLKHPRSWGLAALTVALVAACSGGKISAAVVAVGGMGFVLMVSLIRRDGRAKPTLIAFIGSTASLVTVYVLFLSGSAEQGGLQLFSLLDKASTVQGLNPTNSGVGILIGTAMLLLAIIPRWSGLAWLVASPHHRYSPMTTYGVGLAVVGILTIVFVSGGLNDTWFALASSVPLSILSAVGIGMAMSSIHGSRILIKLGIASVILAMTVGILWASDATAHSFRWLGPLVALIGAVVIAIVACRSSTLRGSAPMRILAITITVLALVSCTGRLSGLASNRIGVGSESGNGNAGLSPLETFIDSKDQDLVSTLTDDQLSAGAFLHSVATADSIVATNVTFSPLVAALSGRPTYVSGIKYQAPYGRPDALPLVLQRELETLQFIESPSSTSAEALCRAGVDWLWLDPRRPSGISLGDFTQQEFTSDSAVILRLLPQTCAA
jgi:hypothetical protein